MKSNIIIVTEENTTSTSWNRVAAGQLKYQLDIFDSHINENRRRGILILMDRSHNFKIKTIRNINQNCSILEVSDGKNEIAIAAIYAPSDKDDPEFLLNIREELEKSTCEFNMITGEFNNRMEFKEDTFGYTNNSHWKSRIVLKEWTEEDYIEAYRYLNPETQDYTFKTKNREKRARINMTLLSSNLLPKLIDTWITHFPFSVTDHAGVS